MINQHICGCDSLLFLVVHFEINTYLSAKPPNGKRLHKALYFLPARQVLLHFEKAIIGLLGSKFAAMNAAIGNIARKQGLFIIY